MLIYEKEALAHRTTFQIGGVARYLLIPESPTDCFHALTFIREKKLQFFILGAGSNVLIGSEPYDGAVITSSQLKTLSLQKGIIYAGAGVINSDMALFAYEEGLGGFEFLYGMPGTLGGSSVMNSRAFGSSMSDIVVAIDVISKDFQAQRLNIKELHYQYKSSIFHKKPYFITQILLKTQKRAKPLIWERMQANKEKRLSSKQHDFPSAGCIFKNNYTLGIPSGQIIDSLGLKGSKIGQAEIYQHHANFIINKADASSHDVLKLIRLIQARVQEAYAHNLECEIQLLGNIKPSHYD